MSNVNLSLLLFIAKIIKIFILLFIAKIYSEKLLIYVKKKMYGNQFCQFVVEICNLYEKYKEKITEIVDGETGLLTLIDGEVGKIKRIKSHKFHGNVKSFYSLMENTALLKCLVSTKKKSFSFSITVFNPEGIPIFVFAPAENKKDKEDIPAFNFADRGGQNEKLEVVLQAHIYKKPTQKKKDIKKKKIEEKEDVKGKRIREGEDVKGKKKVEYEK